ncbi:hypothetical protein FRC03_003742 [Tulasnella sp. 419]|nr:hypothetical protein FRC03_003742 [Tulasnella sp. 419]
MGENGVLNLSELDDRMEEDEDERIMMEIQRELTVDLEDEEPSTTADLSMGQNMDYSFENEGASIAITYNAAGQAIDDDPEIKNEIDDVLQNSMVVDDAGDWTDEQEDENDPPVVEISSKNHEAAARAAAILKLHHDWIEASKRPNLKRRRSSMSVGGFDSPRSMSTPIGRQHSPVSRFQIKRSGLAGSPIQPSLLQQMAAEMSPPKGSAKKAGLGRFASQDIVGPSTPVHNEGTSKSRSNMFRTPIFKPPTIIINPASTVTSQRYIRTYSGEEPTRWMKEDWKHLERCLLAERQRMADEGRYNSPEDVDMEDINVDTVVEKFLEEVNFDEEDLVDEWDVDKIRRRVIALQVRHSPDPQVARSIVSSPSMVVPFTPQIRQRTNHGRSASLAQDTPTSRVRSAMASAPTLLLAHRYSHLYDEASAIAGLPTSSQTTSSTPKQNQDRAKAPTGSRIPVLSSSRHVKPVPPPPPTPKADTPQTPPPVEDTPSATSRVLGFLGLGNILRSSIRSVTKGKAKASDSDKIVPIEEGQTTVIKPRLPTPKPIPESPYNLETMSQEDLNHVEPQSPQLPAPLMHPKDLVELNHVPLPEPQRPASSRKPRVSGGSVKELVKTFEELEDENDRERQRIKEVVRRGRRVVGAGGKSVRRVPSNLSTASVISASDFERSYGDDSMDSSFGTQDNSMDMSMLTDGDISMEGIVQRRKSLLALE